MPIGGNLYSWNENTVNGIAQRAGVYAFYNTNREIIYMGSSNNLRERFQGYWRNNFENDPCKQNTTAYRREFTENYEQRESELLREYRRQHGELPRCNDVVP